MNFGHTPASADEILLSARREITSGALVRVDYTYRVSRDQFEAVETNALMDPTGTRTIGFVNGVPTRVMQYGFTPQSYGKYSGLDVILETRTKLVELQGGYTLSYSWGTLGSGAFDNPRFDAYYHSYQSGVDTRHQIKTSTTVFPFRGFTIGAIVNWRSGVAFSRGYAANEPGWTLRRAPVGYDPGAYYNTGTANPGQLGTVSDVRSWTGLRTPDVLTCNIMLSYDLEQFLHQHVTVNAEIDNVLALQTATAATATEGAPNTNQFGLANTRQGFRTLTLGARYEF
jgi:hypothetical protein